MDDSTKLREALLAMQKEELAKRDMQKIAEKLNGENWRTAFTERELKEIKFCVVYNQEFAHGTDGHNAKIIIAKMVSILDANKIDNLPPHS